MAWVRKPLSVVFSEARKLIEKPENWHQGGLSDGEDIPLEKAKCFCAWGALMLAERSVDMDILRQEFEVAAGFSSNDLSLPSWNDDPETDHADVMARFDRAIAYAQERGL